MLSKIFLTFDYLYSMQLFIADPKAFVHKNFKKQTSKVAHYRPRPFYFTVKPRPQPRIDFSYYEISGPDICTLICAGTYNSTNEQIEKERYLISVSSGSHNVIKIILKSSL